MPLASLISAGASLAGGLIGRSQAKRDRARAERRDDTSVQRRVADAKAAGVHPLFALGAPLSSSVPQSIGTMEGAISNMGQDIGRALEAGNTGSERLSAHQQLANELSLKNMALRNDLLASQIAKINQAGHPPPLPGVKMVPPELLSGIVSGEMLPINPHFSNAQTYEDRHGDLVQNVAGVRNWFADLKEQEASRLRRDAALAKESWYLPAWDRAKRWFPVD